MSAFIALVLSFRFFASTFFAETMSTATEQRSTTTEQADPLQTEFAIGEKSSRRKEENKKKLGESSGKNLRNALNTFETRQCIRPKPHQNFGQWHHSTARQR
jgi:hypothetical protein